MAFQVTGTDAKGKQGKGKGGKGKGAKPPISLETSAALAKVHGEDAEYFDTRREWCEQYPYKERHIHCFNKESLKTECDNGRCPACHPRQ